MDFPSRDKNWHIFLNTLLVILYDFQGVKYELENLKSCLWDWNQTGNLEHVLWSRYLLISLPCTIVAFWWSDGVNWVVLVFVATRLSLKCSAWQGYRNFASKKKFQQKFWVRKNFGSEKNFQKYFRSEKKLGLKKILGLKIFWF